MSRFDHLAPGELVDRWRGAVSTGTLAKWRSRGQGPAWIKIGRRVFYPLTEVEKWEARRAEEIRRRNLRD